MDQKLFSDVKEQFVKAKMFFVCFIYSCNYMCSLAPPSGAHCLKR